MSRAIGSLDHISDSSHAIADWTLTFTRNPQEHRVDLFHFAIDSQLLPLLLVKPLRFPADFVVRKSPCDVLHNDVLDEEIVPLLHVVIPFSVSSLIVHRDYFFDLKAG